MERTLSSIDVGGSVFFVSTSFRGSNVDAQFEVTLVDAGTLDAWKGTFGGDIKAKAKAIEMEEGEFVDQTRKALTRQTMGDLTFEYQVKATKRDGRELSWKKVVSSIKFQLGKVTMEPVTSPPAAMKDILQHSIQTVADLKGSIYRLETENDRLSNERTQALKRLEKCVVQKEQMEGDLYAKFAVILNEKKAKIRDLKDRAPKSVEPAGDGQGQRSQETGSDIIQGTEEAMDMEEDDFDLDTDEEKERGASGHKRQKKAAVSSSRTDRDESIVFEEESPEAPASKARRRRREPTSKKTASSQKPAIPKVPSTGTPSTSRTPSMRKTPSRERSQRSTETDDVEELLDEM